MIVVVSNPPAAVPAPAPPLFFACAAAIACWHMFNACCWSPIHELNPELMALKIPPSGSAALPIGATGPGAVILGPELPPGLPVRWTTGVPDAAAHSLSSVEKMYPASGGGCA